VKLASIAQRIIALKEADFKCRDRLIQTGQLGEGYHKEMEVIHNRNAEALSEIIDQIGYPTIERVGEEASEAAWYVIQHAISQPVFMKRCAQLLEQEYLKDDRYARPFAYLSDRIASFEGTLQLYGTQFDWDENGQLSPKPFDDLERVNARRKLIGLHSLEEQTVYMRQEARRENERPPKDLEQRRKAYDQWRKQVGWID